MLGQTQRESLIISCMSICEFNFAARAEVEESLNQVNEMPEPKKTYL